MTDSMTKVAATITTAAQRQEEQLPSSFYNSIRLKLYIPTEIEHCEMSRTIAKYINAKIIQAKSTDMSYKTRM
jgi:hypothetical protein